MIEIRHIQAPEDPLFNCAQRVNDAAHHYRLEWLDSPHQNYVALDPESPYDVLGVMQVQFIDKHDEFYAGYGDAHITRVAVDNEYRRRGIGSLLVAYAIQEAKEAGLTVMSTQTMTRSAGNLFEKHDFFYAYPPGRKSFFRYCELSIKD